MPHLTDNLILPVRSANLLITGYFDERGGDVELRYRTRNSKSQLFHLISPHPQLIQRLKYTLSPYPANHTSSSQHLQPTQSPFLLIFPPFLLSSFSPPVYLGNSL